MLLHSFTGGADGSSPIAGLIRDSAGNLYGAASLGGHFKVGTVFKLDNAGTFTVLYSFTGAPDGAQPHSNLLRDEQGNLYGTTFSGGDLTCNPSGGCGTVFKVDSKGKETVLHTFTGGADGKFPQAALIRDAAGNLFGTTASGGGAGGGTCGNSGCGTVFEVDNTGKETVLHSFSGAEDGQSVFAGLVVDGQSFYGATGGGSPPAFGTLFKLDKTGIETVLYTFTGGADGGFPFASLVHDAVGNFYGTAGWAGHLVLEQCSSWITPAGRRSCTASRALPTGDPPTEVWFATRQAICTAQRNLAAPSILVRSSKSLPEGWDFQIRLLGVGRPRRSVNSGAVC